MAGEGKDFMAANDKNSIRLRITGPDGLTRESVSELDSIILGSGAGAGIQIADPKVSNLHVMLKVEKNGVVKVIDLGSEGGTLVGEKTIEGPTPLNPGDVIRVGSSRVEVLFGTAGGTVNPGQLPEPVEPQARRVVTAKYGLAVPPNLNPRPAAVPPAQPPPMQSASAAQQVRVTGAPTTHVPQPITSVHVNTAPMQARVQVPPSQQVAMSAAPRLSQAPETLPIHAQATGEAAPKPGNRVLQVAMVWGDTIVGLQHYGDGVPVTIGEGKGNEFILGAPELGARFTLATARGDKGLVQVPKGATVTVFSGAKQVPLEQLRAQGRVQAANGGEAFELGLDERAKVSVGTVCFLVRFVAPSKALPVKKLKKDDLAFMGLAALLLLLGGAVVVAFMMMPKSAKTGFADLDDEKAQAMVKLLVKPKVPVVVPKPVKKQEEKAGAEEGAKAKDEEGAFGKQDAKQAEADPSKAGSPVVDPNKKEKDRKKVMKVGLLAAIGQNGAASDVFGPGGLGTGINDKLGGLKGGAGLTDRQGLGGLGSRGNGTGGGGTGLGLGGLGTKGDGRGGGGTGGIDLGGRGHDTVRIIPGKTVVVGGLSKEVIAKVIRDHQREIKYCYETELNKIPDLAGKVAAMFVIGPDGSVQDANVAETTLNNSTAENCMMTRIKRWKFPEPQGGGIVSVTFPWIFKPAGND